MGSYDLGAQVFSQTSERRVIVVRAPENDPQTQAFEESHRPKTLQVEFNVKSSDLAFELLHALGDGSIVAIQGDRVAGEINDLPATLFGKPIRLPAGPFALALAARVPIHPVFVMRQGRRRYRIVAYPPLVVARGGNRDEAFAEAVGSWTGTLENIIRNSWHQWFTFEPFWQEPAA
jgi:KDO2-lipid IV(A) lauroyltransferase